MKTSVPSRLAAVPWVLVLANLAAIGLLIWVALSPARSGTGRSCPSITGPQVPGCPHLYGTMA